LLVAVVAISGYMYTQSKKRDKIIDMTDLNDIENKGKYSDLPNETNATVSDIQDEPDLLEKAQNKEFLELQEKTKQN
jgi:hypothetical protein